MGVARRPRIQATSPPSPSATASQVNSSRELRAASSSGESVRSNALVPRMESSSVSAVAQSMRLLSTSTLPLCTSPSPWDASCISRSLTISEDPSTTSLPGTTERSSGFGAVSPSGEGTPTKLLANVPVRTAASVCSPSGPVGPKPASGYFSKSGSIRASSLVHDDDELTASSVTSTPSCASATCSGDAHGNVRLSTPERVG